MGRPSVATKAAWPLSNFYENVPTEPLERSPTNGTDADIDVFEFLSRALKERGVSS